MTRRTVRFTVAAMLALFTVLASWTATAHTFAPALLELRELGADRVSVRWKQPAVRVMGSNIQPVLPIDCVGIGKPQVTQEGTGQVASWEIECPSGLIGKSVGVEGIASSRAPVLLRIELEDGRSIGQVLQPEHPSLTVKADMGEIDVFRAYTQLGTGHILSGWDHLLFVLGLVLLVGWGRKLLWTVTAFTLGHSLTLALAVLGLVNLSQATIEVAIAASIYLLAIDLARKGIKKPSMVERWPWGIASLFGLLHGLGFAGALREVGLPTDEIPLALFSFNIGIELGQLLFVATILAVWATLRAIPWTWPVWVERAPAYAIGSLAVFWIFERLTRQILASTPMGT